MVKNSAFVRKRPLSLRLKAIMIPKRLINASTISRFIIFIVLCFGWLKVYGEFNIKVSDGFIYQLLIVKIGGLR